MLLVSLRDAPSFRPRCKTYPISDQYLFPIQVRMAYEPWLNGYTVHGRLRPEMSSGV